MAPVQTARLGEFVNKLRLKATVSEALPHPQFQDAAVRRYGSSGPFILFFWLEKKAERRELQCHRPLPPTSRHANEQSSLHARRVENR
ncbi:hypothetical protein ASC90_25180 [Rhizobium sp. Root1220]|nr:hypothetical protein ASC90_25180 [Rhizobium sp. Root1220]